MESQQKQLPKFSGSPLPPGVPTQWVGEGQGEGENDFSSYSRVNALLLTPHLDLFPFDLADKFLTGLPAQPVVGLDRAHPA